MARSDAARSVNWAAARIAQTSHAFRIWMQLQLRRPPVTQSCSLLYRQSAPVMSKSQL